jgi:hypothetical protein
MDFKGGNSLCLLQIGLFTCIEERHVSLQRKTFMKEAAASSILFSRENTVSFCQEYFLQIKFSRWKRLILLQIQQFSLVEETHVSL